MNTKYTSVADPESLDRGRASLDRGRQFGKGAPGQMAEPSVGGKKGLACPK